MNRSRTSSTLKISFAFCHPVRRRVSSPAGPGFSLGSGAGFGSLMPCLLEIVYVTEESRKADRAGGKNARREAGLEQEPVEAEEEVGGWAGINPDPAGGAGSCAHDGDRVGGRGAEF